MEERIKNLESKIDTLISTTERLIKVNKYLVDKLDKYLDSTTKDTKIEIPQRLVSNQDVRIPKDRVLIQSLLERATQEYHIKFLNNILASSYDSLTVKQNSVLENIKNSI